MILIRDSSLLRNRDFRQLFYCDSVSQFGTQVSQLALPLVAIIVLHASAFQVGSLSALQFIGALLIGLPAGAWVDRWRRRRVLIAGDLGRAIAFASVPVAWWSGWLTMAQLYLVAVLVGLCTVFFDVAYQSYLPSLVGREQLAEGNARLEAVRNVSLVGGPSAAGGIVAMIGAPAAIAVDAVSFVLSALFVGRIQMREEQVARPVTRLRREIADGLRFVFANASLRSILVGSSVYNLFGGMVSAMVIVLMARDLGMSPAFIGLAFSITAVGALLGALVMRPIAARFGYGPTVWLALAVTGPFGLLLPLADRGWRLWIAVAGYSVVWFGTTVYNIAQLSLRQALTPGPMLGRMNASIRSLVIGMTPLGNVVGGGLAQTFGVRTALWVGSIGVATSFLPAFLSPLRSTRDLPEVAPLSMDPD